LALGARAVLLAPLNPPALLPLGLLAAALAAPAPAAVAAPAAAPPPYELRHTQWPAEWIACAGAEGHAPGVYHFRTTLELPGRPEHYVVHVSADNRFILYVNGSRIGAGPARADLAHWRYETFDLAPRLHAGRNVLAATVWNYGADAPLAQISDQTAFLVQGDSPAEAAASTNATWEAELDPGRTFLPTSGPELHTYYAASPAEHLDAATADWAWQTSPAPWAHAVTIGTGQPGRYALATPRGTGSGISPWFLVADPLPPMDYRPIGPGRIVRIEGVPAFHALPATIPAHTRASLLTDWGMMTTAYPEFAFSGGAGARVRLTYAEALVDAKGAKGNRNETDGRTIFGLADQLALDGSADRTWSPLWWRSWRYLQVDVETGDQPLQVRGLTAEYTAYPFTDRGVFRASDPELARFFAVGAWTARMNAHETYSDCPYYEQLQYLGDTRIQALVSYVTFGDDRLARQALDAFDQSRIPDGLTQSRYPAALMQVIPTFSLLWVGMLHDYWMYRPDDGSLRTWVEHSRTVLAWYAAQQRTDGLLKVMPWWNFADWTRDYPFGVPPQDDDGGSSVLALHFIAALRDGADLESATGNFPLASDYRRRADRIAISLYQLCWDESRGLLADTPAKAHFSEQANALAVLLDVIPRDKQPGAMRAVLDHRVKGPPVPTGEFSPASLYFRFYVARAMEHAGLADFYLQTLEPWHAMLARGLTTWAETVDPTRSDDHAWSAHPN
jgi:hypothetical protein